MGEISVFSDFFYILVLEQSKVVTLKKKNPMEKSLPLSRVRKYEKKGKFPLAPV